MKPKEVLEKWIDCFNKADAYHIAELYATNAVNHQVANEPIIGKESILLRRFSIAGERLQARHKPKPIFRAS